MKRTNERRVLKLGLLCAAWMLGAGAAHADTKVRVSSFEYNAAGLLIKEVIEPDSANDCLQTTHGYDQWGNKNSVSTLKGLTNMPSGHKKEAIQTLRHRYGEKWSVKIIPVGVELRRDVSSEMTQHIFFNFVRDDMLGIRIQPGLGVTFAAVNLARDAIAPRHQYTVDPVTGFVFLNNLIEAKFRQNGGWLFESGKPLHPAFDHFLDFVDEVVSRVGFFDSLQTLDHYIAAVEGARWAFIATTPLYLYALIAVGKVVEAKELAAYHRMQEFNAAAKHGRMPHESNIQPYDEILRMPEDF